MKIKEFIINQQEKGYHKQTVKNHTHWVIYYLNWIKTKGYQSSKITYQQLIQYVGHLKEEQNKSNRSINDRLRAISNYNQFRNWTNIAHTVRVKGETKEQALLLSEEELSSIYYNWINPIKGYQKYSNHIILGLIIYQALVEKDIYSLEISHLNLEKGNFYVPGGSTRKKGRTLALESHQIIPLYNYITNHRNKESYKLFSPNADKEQRLHEQFKHLNKQIKNLNPELPVKKLQQLQQSRIALWIEKYGLRKTQYMAGYRSINQIEKLQKENINELQNLLTIYHPFNQ